MVEWPAAWREPLIAWLHAEPVRRVPRAPVNGGRPEFFLTGPDLIARIVRAIELGQSVVLSGPRGCGKSYCVNRAIEQAQEKGILAAGASVFLQGNREIPRDYLIEDEIVFRTQQMPGGSKVVPAKRPAPLFRFARRDEEYGEPIADDNDEVACVEPRGGRHLDKFVLFLDEINRFSDGVLDSLLSVLEERKAVMGGRLYKLPVVVCMTMNPPGYDATARKLSPPLAARIGRSYRLSTPDLDTLGDIIIAPHLEQLRRQMARSERLDAVELDVAPRLVRKAALVTLCLWGDTEQANMGQEYLTPETVALLARVMRADPLLRRHMRRISDLCRFGPDGRAARDWLLAATGVAREEAARLGRRKVVLEPRHLVTTVIESVAHKIYDNFSPAAAPDKTALKEQAVQTVCQRILSHGRFDEMVYRQVDDRTLLGRAAASALAGEVDGRQLQRAFLGAQVTRNDEVAAWLDLLHTLASSYRGLPSKSVLRRELVDRELFTETEDDLPAAYCASRFDLLASALEEFSGAVPRSLVKLRQDLGPPRPTLRQQIANYRSVRELQVDAFLNVCHQAGLVQRRAVNALVWEIEELWVLATESEEGDGWSDAWLSARRRRASARRHRSQWDIRPALLGLLDHLLHRQQAPEGVPREPFLREIAGLRQALEDSTLEDSALGNSALGNSALGNSALEDSALEDSALEDSATSQASTPPPATPPATPEAGRR